MNEGPPILQGQPPSDEQNKLLALFDELEKGQLGFLDQAGKRIVELCTGLMGVLFAVTAFGEKFPPPYLENDDTAQWLVVLTLVLYLGAMFMGLWTVQPRRYKRYRHNLSEMEKVLEQIIRSKSRALRAAGVLFWLASLMLALLIASVILGA